MTIAETDRLYLRHMSTDDAAFILELVNEPAWLEFIGDRGVHHLDDARAYIANGPIAMVERHGFALSVVIRKADLAPIGICGLLKRDTLDDVDLGFALLARYCGHSYAREAAQAAIAYGFGSLGLKRIVAIAKSGNTRSLHLLESLGFTPQGLVTITPGEPPVCLLALVPLTP